MFIPLVVFCHASIFICILPLDNLSAYFQWRILCCQWNWQPKHWKTCCNELFFIWRCQIKETISCCWPGWHLSVVLHEQKIWNGQKLQLQRSKWQWLDWDTIIFKVFFLTKIFLHRKCSWKSCKEKKKFWKRKLWLGFQQVTWVTSKRSTQSKEIANASSSYGKDKNWHEACFQNTVLFPHYL